MQGDLPLPVILLIVFGSAKLMGEIFVKLRQPALVGEILAGAVIGPSLLGWIAPNQTLTALSDLGVMFLLFDAGLQVRASDLLRVGGTAALAAALGVATTFFGGWSILRAWGSPPMEAIFVATALVATSVDITASALSARGLLNQVASRIILAAAVIDDVLGLIVLAVVSGLSQGRINALDVALTAGWPSGLRSLRRNGELPQLVEFCATFIPKRRAKRRNSISLWCCCSRSRRWRSIPA